MISSSTSAASPPAPLVKTSGGCTTAILVAILVSYFMILLDNSIIFTALPKIHAAMRFSPVGLAWVQDAYTLVFGVHTALTTGTVPLGACLLAALGLILPAHPRNRRLWQAAMHRDGRCAVAPASAMTSA